MTKPDTELDPGTLIIDQGTATLRFERRLPHPIDAVWAAITDPSARARWFGPTRIEAHAGGAIETVPDDPPVPEAMKRMEGRILVWDPPHVLEHEWVQQIVEPGVIRYELRSDGETTVLTFTHRGLGVANARGFIPGTHAYLDRLAAALDGTAIPDWSDRIAELRPAYA
jgi:uncharacterized protein YndB with AHSA1/START domain